MSRLAAYESCLELARIMLADFDPSVAGIAAQPFVLAGADGTGNGVMFLACCWRTRTAGSLWSTSKQHPG
jgi:hypothetical protein